jgi:Tfp pilus assembly protein PilN
MEQVKNEKKFLFSARAIPLLCLAGFAWTIVWVTLPKESAARREKKLTESQKLTCPGPIYRYTCHTSRGPKTILFSGVRGPTVMLSSIAAEVDLIEELRLRRWAREHYVPRHQREMSWHPVILDEMDRKDSEMAEVEPVFTCA